MDHEMARQQSAVEKYLLGELSPTERDEFEEHYFGCAHCADELKSTAAFIDAAKRELGRQPARRAARDAATPPRLRPAWRPATAALAFGLLAGVLIYQNVLIYPPLRAQHAQMQKPEVLAAVSLIGLNSRGGGGAQATVADGQSLLLSFDVPASGSFAKYTADLVDSAGAPVCSVPLSAEQAKDTVAIRLPPQAWHSGEYTMIVRGYGEAGAEPTALARYRFNLNPAK